MRAEQETGHSVSSDDSNLNTAWSGTGSIAYAALGKNKVVCHL